MSIANLHFSRIFIHLSHLLYICKQNLQAAMDKEGLWTDSRYVVAGSLFSHLYKKKITAKIKYMCLELIG
jgi:hypothetical protein